MFVSLYRLYVCDPFIRNIQNRQTREGKIRGCQGVEVAEDSEQLLMVMGFLGGGGAGRGRAVMKMFWD